MDKHWDSYCSLSLVHFLAFPECQAGGGPLVETIGRIVEDDFFSAIEITRINDPKLRQRVAKLIEQSHLKVDFGAHPVILGEKLNLNSLDAAERTKATKMLERYIDQAVELGARRFVILSGRDPGPANRKAATDALVESIKQLCAYGKERHMPVVLETFDREVDKRTLIGPAGEAAEVAARVKAEFADFGLLYDMAHMVLLDETPLAGLTAMKEHVVHVHVGNCVKEAGRASYGDFHPRFGFPGSENDVPQLVEFIQALFQVGYLRDNPPVGARPGVGFEVRPQVGESSVVILGNVKRAWREAWARV